MGWLDFLNLSPSHPIFPAYLSSLFQPSFPLSVTHHRAIFPNEDVCRVSEERYRVTETSEALQLKKPDACAVRKPIKLPLGTRLQGLKWTNI